jgi:glucosamine--fructose-6-phosphate aminotransferase (isomerizing)
MCGIVGYVGRRPCRELLLRGLERLEYRGYDSAGLSLVREGRIESVREVGNLARLRAAVERAAQREDDVHLAATTGIGHTRWATHGRVTEDNAHPHFDTSERVHIVLNGIVENHAELRRELMEEGARFTSETDAEVVAHLIARYLDGDLVEAVRRAYGKLRGHYSFVATSADFPDLLVGARKECPLVVGVGGEEHFVASAVPAFLDETKLVKGVGDGEIVALTPDGAQFFGPDGARVERAPEEIDWDTEAAEKGGYETFMLKEIHEQPAAVAQTVFDRVRNGRVELPELGVPDAELAELSSLRIVACGTSYHAGLIGRYLIEEWARLPVEIDIASEYRYRNPVVGPGDLCVGITQSGETADTLAAMRLVRERGGTVVALTNIMGSQATRDADGVLYTRAGVEIGVAATKTFVAQVAAMCLLGLKLAQVRGTLPAERVAELCAEMGRLPDLIERTIAETAPVAEALAERWAEQDFFLYLGRHAGLPVALEGALKLKEVSYIPTDAYAAGEMKHGPIALLAEGTPVVCVATDSPVLEKTVSNIEEVRARGAEVVAIATEDGELRTGSPAEVIAVPRTDWLLQPILAIVPLQLLSYHVARRRGLNVDQPRNLAKTVTVE